MTRQYRTLVAMIATSIALLGVNNCGGKKYFNLIKYNRDNMLIEASDFAAEQATFEAPVSGRFKNFEIVDSSESLNKCGGQIFVDGDKFILLGRSNKEKILRLMTMRIADITDSEVRTVNGFRRGVHGFDVGDGKYIMTDSHTIRIFNETERDYRNGYDIEPVCISGDRIFALTTQLSSPTLYVFDFELKVRAKKVLKNVNLPGQQGLRVFSWDLEVSSDTIYIIPRIFNVLFVYKYSGGELTYEGQRQWHDTPAFNVRELINLSVGRELAKHTKRQRGYGFAPFYVIQGRARAINSELFGWVSATQDWHSNQYLLHLHGDQTDVIAMPETGAGWLADWVPVMRDGKLEIFALQTTMIFGGISLVRYYN